MWVRRRRSWRGETDVAGEGGGRCQGKMLVAEKLEAEGDMQGRQRCHLRLSSREASAEGTCWATQGQEVLNGRNLGQNYDKKIQL